ncbi:MAG TPA: hypothetical protein VGC84_01015, partial [Ilumatobacteraceae bacterium]
GDDRGRPSTLMLGLLSFWYDIQGSEQEARLAAQRGIDVAPFDEHPDTAICWFEFAGATAQVAAQSPEAVNAFRHEVAAVANMAESDLNWPHVVYLTDASLHADPSATPALRRKLTDMAARLKSPTLMLFSSQFEGHASMTASPPDFNAAATAYARMREQAERIGDLQSQAGALRGVAMAATGVGAPDALARCHDALEALIDLRYWQKTWQALESVTMALAAAGRTEDAAVILGRIDVQSSGFGVEHDLGFRAKARALIEADGGHAEAQLRGSRMSPEEIVTAALAYCAADATT